MRRGEIPSDIAIAIKAKAASEWPGDYSMQAHMIEQESEAYNRICHFKRNLDLSNEVTTACMKTAEIEWPHDFGMQMHVFESQMNSANEFFSVAFVGIPKEIVEEVRLRAFSEWPGDFDMMLHVLNEQLSAWLSIKR